MRPVVEVIVVVLRLYSYIIFAEVVILFSGVLGILNNSSRLVYVVSDFVHRLADPSLSLVRRFVPRCNGIDMSPLVVLILIYLLQRYLIMYVMY